MVDFKSVYHAILRCSVYARFMAQPCYVYLKLKIPGPNGVITLTGDRKRAEDCLQHGSAIADSQMAAVELDKYKKTGVPSDLLTTKKVASDSAFQSARETKKLQVHSTDPFQDSQWGNKYG